MYTRALINEIILDLDLDVNVWRRHKWMSLITTSLEDDARDAMRTDPRKSRQLRYALLQNYTLFLPALGDALVNF